jgi:hypothetical protein
MPAEKVWSRALIQPGIAKYPTEILKKNDLAVLIGLLGRSNPQSVCRLTALETVRYSYGRSIGCGLRDDTSAGQRHVRIDLKGDGDQR